MCDFLVYLGNDSMYICASSYLATYLQSLARVSTELKFLMSFSPAEVHVIYIAEVSVALYPSN